MNFGGLEDRIEVAKTYNCESPGMAKVILICIAIVALALAHPASAEGFAFGITTNPLERENRTIHVEISLVQSEVERIGKLVRRFETNPNGLGDGEKLDVCKWYLWHLEFVKAERLAERLVADNKERDAKYLAMLGFAKICRGDYEGAKRALLKPDAGAERGQRELGLWVQVLLLEEPDQAADGIRALVAKESFNNIPWALQASLAFCIMDPKKGGSLFDAILLHIDRAVIVMDPICTKLYLRACEVFGKQEERRSIEQRLRRSPKADSQEVGSLYLPRVAVVALP